MTVDAPRGYSAVATGRRVAGRWRASGVRELAAAVGRFAVARRAVPIGGHVVRVSAVVPRAAPIDAAAVAGDVRLAVERFSSRFGAYPWHDLTFVVTPDLGRSGIEYPQLVFLGSRGQRALSHEVAHQWFYSLVGNDQARDPWLDESLATWAGLEVDGALLWLDTQRVPAWARGRLGEPMTYWDRHDDDYFAGVYLAGAQKLGLLGTPAEVNCALRDYVAARAWQIADPDDLVAALEARFPGARARLRAAGDDPRLALPAIALALVLAPGSAAAHGAGADPGAPGRADDRRGGRGGAAGRHDPRRPRHLRRRRHGAADEAPPDDPRRRSQRSRARRPLPAAQRDRRARRRRRDREHVRAQLPPERLLLGGRARLPRLVPDRVERVRLRDLRRGQRRRHDRPRLRVGRRRRRLLRRRVLAVRHDDLDVVAVLSAVGYSGTNASGLTIRDSLWDRNGAGILPNTFADETDPPQHGARFVDNVVRSSGRARVPINTPLAGYFGIGIAIAGGSANDVRRNRVTGSTRYGIAVFATPHAIRPSLAAGTAVAPVAKRGRRQRRHGQRHRRPRARRRFRHAQLLLWQPPRQRVAAAPPGVRL